MESRILSTVPPRSVIVSHPTGNANVRAILEGLEARGLLKAYLTDFAWNERAFWLSLLPPRLREQAMKRSYRIPPGRISNVFGREAVRQFGIESGWRGLVEPTRGWASPDQVYRRLDEKAARSIREGRLKADAIYAYEGAASRTFPAAREAGMRLIYELPIAYVTTRQRILTEEAERDPEWAQAGLLLHESPEKTAAQIAEAEMADHIVVPSRFVYESLPEAIRAKTPVTVAPYGSPPTPDTLPERANDGKFRVLFVGQMSQRKGFAYLGRAARRFEGSEVEFHIIGSRVGPEELYQKEFPSMVYHGTQPHPRVLDAMATADLFVFPSLCEGRALVQQEALSRGLPLVTTLNAGADDLIEDGVTGQLVPIRDADALAAAIERFLLGRAEAEDRRRACIAKAESLTWESFAGAALEGAGLIP
ncbi:hypothetical protein BH11ARM2_BH11ARM2_28120 [soil metagenome]